jgi:hypothetical protein
MATWNPNPAGFDALEAFLGRIIVHEVAPAIAAKLDEKISRGGRSGVQYPSYPQGVRASSPTEYPQEVTGNLRDSLDAQQVGKTTAAIGFIRNLNRETIQQIVGLEFKPPRLGGRKPIRRALRDPDIHQAATNALRNAI